MGDKPIQEQFGERVIAAFAEFARADLKPVGELVAAEFAHIEDEALRESLARVFYGTRWIYKLGLALLTKDEERAAHIRAQLVDYGSVCEGVLSYCIGHAIRKGHAQGTAYQWHDPDKQKRPIVWNSAAPEPILAKVSFWWLIHVANTFGIVAGALERDLQWVRNRRNSVHLRHGAIGHVAYLNHSRRSFNTVISTIECTKNWMLEHP